CGIDTPGNRVQTPRPCLPPSKRGGQWRSAAPNFSARPPAPPAPAGSASPRQKPAQRDPILHRSAPGGPRQEFFLLTTVPQLTRSLRPCAARGRRLLDFF